MLRVVKSDAALDSEDRSGSSAGRSDELLPLMRTALGGDAVAMRTFLTTVLPAMLSVVRRVLGNKHPDVEDVTQEAAVGLLRALASFRQDCTVSHFACRVAVLTSLAARRRRRYEASLSGVTELDIVEHTASDLPGPAQAAASSRRRAILRDLLDSLSDVQGEALVLHCVLGYSIDEVAEMMAVPSNTARSRVRLAKDALRNRVVSDRLLDELLREES
jgi:RNA polymerase sigma factor (sigma-70 family)